ncbi:hypothetical protein Gotur_001096 [Gossypium turneri]
MFRPKYMFSPPPSSAPSPSVRLGHKISITTIHVMALDGIVNVNSLFTFAIFLGLAWYPIPTLIDPSSPASCAAGSNIAENLISCHVYSFSSFLFSSLIALAIKQAIKISKDSNDLAAHGVGASLVDVNLMALRVGMLVSSFGSVLGCGFLMMALVALVQIKLGTLGCGSIYTFAAIGPLVVLVQRGHELHIFTSSPNSTFPRYPVTYLVFHPPKTTADGYLEQAILLRTPKEQAHVLTNRVMKVAEAVIVLVSGDGYFCESNSTNSRTESNILRRNAPWGTGYLYKTSWNHREVLEKKRKAANEMLAPYEGLLHFKRILQISKSISLA